MTIFEAIILGLIQGLTEFLPVSSSGHLKLGELLLGLHHLNQYVTFDLTCHLGTLFAIFVVFWKELVQIFTTERRILYMIVIAILPLGPLYFLLHGIKSFYGLPNYLGFFFLLSALFLYVGEKFSRPPPKEISKKRSICEALFIGCAQAIAILPAVSRSGSTMAAARFLGWEREKAAKFSFFLAVPTILGGMVIEGYEYYKNKDVITGIDFAPYFVGFVVSFIVGVFVLKMLLKLIRKLSLKPFACYCFIMGLITIFYVNFIYAN